jgi:hypothetical protein
MRNLNIQIQQAIESQDEMLVQKAKRLADALKTSTQRRDKVRQLRNFQSLAEQTRSWQGLALFMRYQAARGEIDQSWVEEQAISILESLREQAGSIVQKASGRDENLILAVHMALVARVLGYTARWHYIQTKGQEE